MRWQPGDVRATEDGGSELTAEGKARLLAARRQGEAEPAASHPDKTRLAVTNREVA